MRIRAIALLLVAASCKDHVGPDPVEPPAGSVPDPDLAAMLHDLAMEVSDTPGADARAEKLAELAMAYDANVFNTLAETCYRRALAARPKEPKWWYGLAFVLERVNRYDEAVDAAQHARDLAPDYAPLHRSMALWALARGRLDEAEASARRAVAVSHGGAGAMIALGRVQMEQGHDAEAAESFSKAIAGWPAEFGASGYAHFLYGNALARLGRAEEAAKELARGRGDPPQLPDPWRGEVAEHREGFQARLSRAHRMIRQNQFDDAIGMLEELRKRRPGHAQVLSDLGTAYLLTSRANDAVAVLDEAVKANPAALEPRLLLARSLNAAGRRGDALRQVQTAVEANPTSGEALAARGWLLARGGRAEEALVDFDAAARLDPASASTPALAGAVQISLDRLDAAATSFRRALRIDSTQTTAIAGLAIVAVRRGDLPAADELLARIERLPDDSAPLVAQARAARAGKR